LASCDPKVLENTSGKMSNLGQIAQLSG